jgi:hypothetical protein
MKRKLVFQVPFAPDFNELATDMLELGLAMLHDGEEIPTEYLSPNDDGIRPSFIEAVVEWQLDVHYDLYVDTFGETGDEDIIIDAAERLAALIKLRRLLFRPE